jgi:hypothetical protein
MIVGLLRYWLSCLVFLILIGVSQRSAAEPARILFVSQEQTPFSARIRAEIEAMGLTVVSADTVDDAQAADAAAHVIESPPPRRVELWLRDERAGRLVLDRVLEAEQMDVDPGSADATSAVRASEQLRAFFQPLREESAATELMPPRPPPPPLKSRPSREAAARPSTSLAASAEEDRFFQELAAAVPHQPGSPGLVLVFGARLRFGPTYGLGAKLVLPVMRSTVSSEGNAADVSASLVGLESSARIVTTALATLDAHAGISLLWLSASGRAQAPYTARVDSKLAALPSLGSELGFRLTKHVRLCLGAELGVALPQLELAFAGQSVATWGRPFALLSLGVGVAWGKP